jgi:hypothetical protein
MGQLYKRTILEEVRRIGGGAQLRVYVNPEGVSREYRRHVIETFQELGAILVMKRADANFIFEGHAVPSVGDGVIVAYLDGEKLRFAGSLPAKELVGDVHV